MRLCGSIREDSFADGIDAGKTQRGEANFSAIAIVSRPSIQVSREATKSRNPKPSTFRQRQCFPSLRVLAPSR